MDRLQHPAPHDLVSSNDLFLRRSISRFLSWINYSEKRWVAARAKGAGQKEN